MCSEPRTRKGVEELSPEGCSLSELFQGGLLRREWGELVLHIQHPHITRAIAHRRHHIDPALRLLSPAPVHAFVFRSSLLPPGNQDFRRVGFRSADTGGSWLIGGRLSPRTPREGSPASA